MRGEWEIRELQVELERLIGFIGELGTDAEVASREVTFASNVVDALSWVLEEIATPHFRSPNYLNMPHLREITKQIEERMGKRLGDYE